MFVDKGPLKGGQFGVVKLGSEVADDRIHFLYLRRPGKIKRDLKTKVSGGGRGVDCYKGIMRSVPEDNVLERPAIRVPS